MDNFYLTQTRDSAEVNAGGLTNTRLDHLQQVWV